MKIINLILKIMKMTFQKSKKNFESRFEIMIRGISQFIKIFNNVIIARSIDFL